MLKRDISGPLGNVFSLMGLAKDLAKQLELNHSEIITEMMEADYNHALKTFNLYFGNVVELISPHEIESIDSNLYTVEPNQYV